MGLIQAGVGIAQTAIAASKKTTPMKEYSATPESKLAGQMALETAKQGASQAERAQFGQQLARQQTGFEQMFRNSGMQGVGNAVSSIFGADSINRFAVDNANLMRQGRSDYANWAQSMQSISDKNVAQNNQLALAESQAQGGAVQAGIGNIIGGINSGSNAMMANKSIDMYGKIAANANSDMSGGGGGGGFSQSPYANNPSPAWTSQQPFMLQNQYLPQQGGYIAPGAVDPSLLGTPSFGSPGFGGQQDWSQLWGPQ
jgi:hypothetical protein